MSEPGDEGAAVGGSSAAGSETPAASRHRTPSLALPSLGLTRGLRGREGWGLGLAGALFLVVALVASGPLWAPLLPWAARNEPAPAAPRQPREPPSQPSTTSAEALQALDRRVAALEAKPAASASDLAEIRQEVAKLAGSATELATRIEEVDKTVHSQPAGDPTDIALVLALLQIRDAVEAGRPFRAPYEALAALAQARPEIMAAAAPLAAPATAGLAGRPVLSNRLRELAPAIAAPNPPTNPPATTDAAAPDWADQAWRRLSGLVRVRRIDSAGQEQEAGGAAAEAASPAASVNAALEALAGGDLEGAVGALEGLTGPAETAGPWLRMAKERLAAEAALQRIEALLVARLGTPLNAPASSGPPR
jgi:hypothetical protein